jgi:hypothetical protein
MRRNAATSPILIAASTRSTGRRRGLRSSPSHRTDLHHLDRPSTCLISSGCSANTGVLERSERCQRIADHPAVSARGGEACGRPDPDQPGRRHDRRDHKSLSLALRIGRGDESVPRSAPAGLFAEGKRPAGTGHGTDRRWGRLPALAAAIRGTLATRQVVGTGLPAIERHEEESTLPKRPEARVLNESHTPTEL